MARLFLPSAPSLVLPLVCLSCLLYDSFFLGCFPPLESPEDQEVLASPPLFSFRTESSVNFSLSLQAVLSAEKCTADNGGLLEMINFLGHHFMGTWGCNVQAMHQISR